MLPRQRRLKLAGNLHAVSVVQLAEQPHDAIGYAFVSNWSNDHKVPAQVIKTKLMSIVILNISNENIVITSKVTYLFRLAE